MPRYRYLIIGGGMTADAAIGGIRSIDAEGSIGLIGAESHPPYNRPPLSKALWKGQPIEIIWRRREHPLEVTYHLGRTVLAVNGQDKSVVDDQGTAYQFERLLFATGGTPRRLPFGTDRIIYYRTLDDYQRLRTLSEHGQQFAVIGGGFIGSEVAAALAMNGKKVVMLFPEEGIGARIFPAALAHWLNEFYREKGVEVLAGEQVIDLAMAGEGRVLLKTRSRREVPVDGVVAGIGIQPNTALAEAVGLRADNGILIDESLRTQHEAMYAAGDVANFYSPALGTRLRVEHEDNANMMGQAAGRAMAGEAAPYHHLPSFYSDLFELSYEAVGDVDARLETIIDWEEPYQKGVLYYRRGGRVAGVLLWNTWGQLDAARALIAEPGPFSSADLKGRLPVR